jgi:hypothetical protein
MDEGKSVNPHLRASSIGDAVRGTGRHDERCRKPVSIQPRFNLDGWPLAATNRHPPRCATSHLSSAYPKSAEHTVLRDKPPRPLQVKCSTD